MAKKKYTFIDLFAGCGGLSEGFLRTGRFNALAHVEWEKPMVETLRNRLVTKWNESEENAKKKVILFDIQKTEELINGNWSDESIAQYGEHNSGKVRKSGLKGVIGNKLVDLIIGGPPCQAYSIHGRATDKDSMNNDYRNYLFESFCRVVDEFRPNVFVFENVGGLLSAKPGGVPVRKRIYDAFTQIGYQILTPEEMPSALYNAVNFNVPQYRPRVIILGVRRDSNIDLNDLYKSIEREQKLNKKLTVKDAIGHLPPLYPLGQQVKDGRYMRSHQLNSNLEITQHEARNHGLLSDAKIRKNIPQHLVGGDFAYYGAEVVDGFADVLGCQVGRQAGGQAVTDAEQGSAGVGEGLRVALVGHQGCVAVAQKVALRGCQKSP